MGEFNWLIAKANRYRLAMPDRLHERWALPFAYRQQRSLLPQFKSSVRAAENESCLVHAWPRATAIHFALHNGVWAIKAPGLVLRLRMRPAIPAHAGLLQGNKLMGC